MSGLTPLPCIDSPQHANVRRRELEVPRHVARDLGISAVEAAVSGTYRTRSGSVVDWSASVAQAMESKVSIPPDEALRPGGANGHATTLVQVCNETTLGAAQGLVRDGGRPLALNFANGVTPGGGFLNGARAQEEVLCRSSALYRVLAGDPMYEAHRARPEPDSTAWVIYTPDVPVFRSDDGAALDVPWLLSFATCAAPYAPRVGRERSRALLKERIHRVLAVGRAFGHSELVLGAWGCGAFANDPFDTAVDFREALEGPFAGAFSNVIFAITDWSDERRYLGPFRDVFS